MLEGRLSEFSLPDVFQLLALTKKSGTLRVTYDDVEGRVHFRLGDVHFAVSDVRRMPLGARLVAAGLLTEAQLREVLEAHRGGGAGLSQALVDSGVLDEEQLDTFLREQVQDAVFNLMRLDDAAFAFEPSAEPSPAAGPSLATDELVMEASRRLGEWANVRQQVPSADALVALRPTPADGQQVSLSLEEWQLLVLVDGRRRVRDLVDLTGAGEYATCQVLARLVRAGLVEAVEPGSGKRGELAALLERREQLRRLEEIELGAPAAPPAPPRPVPSPPARPVVEPPTAPAARPPAVPQQPAVEPPAAPADRPPAVPQQPAVEQRPPLPEQPSPRMEEPALADERQRPATDQPAPAERLPQAAPAPAPAMDEPAGEPQPADIPPAPAVSQPARAGVDRSQVARELASLGLNDTPAPPRPRPASPAGETKVDTGGASKVGEQEGRPDGQRRLTRDEDVNKGLLLRLIDGVKGA